MITLHTICLHSCLCTLLSYTTLHTPSSLLDLFAESLVNREIAIGRYPHLVWLIRPALSWERRERPHFPSARSLKLIGLAQAAHS